MNFIAMRAIDYNLLLSFIDKVTSQFKKYAPSYGVTGEIDVLPAYPRDLSKYKKPSIIIQKIDTSKNPIGMGNVAGRYFDIADNAYYDAYGIEHAMAIQIDINCDTNTQMLLFEGIIGDDSITDIKIGNHGEFDINDYVADEKNPILGVGTAKIIGDCDVVNLEVNENNNYFGFVRVDIETIQTIVPTQTLVDLSKGIKYTQTIQL